MTRSDNIMANAVTRREFDDMKEKVDKISDAVFGNGKPGMDEQIRFIYEWIRQREKREDFWYKTVVGTSVSAIILLIINGLIFLFRIMPVLEQAGK